MTQRTRINMIFLPRIFAGLFWINLDYWSWYKVTGKPNITNDDGTETKVSIWPTATTYSLVNYIDIKYTELSYIYIAVFLFVLTSYLLIQFMLKYKFPGRYYSNVTLLSHYCHNSVTLLSHLFHTCVTQMPHYCYTSVTILSLLCHYAVTLLLLLLHFYHCT